MSRPTQRSEQGSVTLFLLGLGVALLLLGGIALDLWRVLGDRRELSSLADAAAIAATSGLDVDGFRETGVAVLDPLAVELRIDELLWAQPEASLLGLSAPQVSYMVPGCDVAVRFERRFDFTLLAFGNADDITLSATGCATLHQG